MSRVETSRVSRLTSLVQCSHVNATWRLIVLRLTLEKSQRLTSRVTASKRLNVSRQCCLASNVPAIAKDNGLASKCLNIICGGGQAIVGESERRQGLAPCHLSPQQHRAAEPPSSSLLNSQTRILSNCQTIKLYKN